MTEEQRKEAGSARIVNEIAAYKSYLVFLRKARRLQEFCEWNALPYPEPLRRMLKSYDNLDEAVTK